MYAYHELQERPPNTWRYGTGIEAAPTRLLVKVLMVDMVIRGFTGGAGAIRLRA